jgi:Uma2 family endonuclease
MVAGMTIAVRPEPMSVPAFLGWVQEQQGRYELKDGAIRMMTGATRGHVRLLFRMVRALATKLDESVWFVGSNDLAVRIGENIRYPDIVVEPAGGDDADLVARAPALIVEVLSPSSLHIDMREKVDEYLSLPSLAAYIVASQDEPRLWVWLRGEDGAFPKHPEPVAGADKTVTVKALGLSLALGEIYAGIGRP